MDVANIAQTRGIPPQLTYAAPLPSEIERLIAIAHDDSSPVAAGEALRTLDGLSPSDIAQGQCAKLDRFGYPQVHFAKGDKEGEAFAKLLASRLKVMGERINALDDLVRIPIKARNGDVIGYVTGKKVKSAWNKQIWNMHPKGTLLASGTDAATGEGVTNIRTDAFDKATLKIPIADYADTLVLHEMSHVWYGEMGRPVREERVANDTAIAIGREIGIVFRDGVVGGGRTSSRYADIFFHGS